MLGKPSLSPMFERQVARSDYGVTWNNPPNLVRRPNWGGRDPISQIAFLGFRLVRPSNHEGEHHEKEG